MDRRPLRLVVYDNADRDFNVQRIRQALSTGVNDAIDAVLPDDVEDADFDVPLGLSQMWMGGGWLYRALRRVDANEGFDNWAEALSWLATYGGNRPISDIQYWGHGSPGRVWMLEDGALDDDTVAGGEHVQALLAIKRRLTPDARIWFRCCGVFAGRRGQAFARAWSEAMECRVVAHTHVIGFWHAGAHNAYPGQQLTWSPTEGLTPDGRMRPSTWSSPNRLHLLSNEVPRHW